MKKLTLDLQSLRVESFQPAPEGPRGGTPDPLAPLLALGTVMPIVSTDDPAGCSNGQYTCDGGC